jgi:hypothetical protein
MKDLLERLIKLAEEWRDFSRSVNGWDCREYLDHHVSCYFAHGGDHASVSFYIRDRSITFDTIQIAFHEEPTVNGFTLRSQGYIDIAIIRYTEELKKLKVIFAGQDKAQAKREKDQKIKGLELQLKELKGNQV